LKVLVLFSVFALASNALPQSSQSDTHIRGEKAKNPKKGAAAEIGSGVGATAAGVAKGAGNAAAGVGKGALDLATLHPIDAGVAVGTGAGKAGKDVTVGTAKGAGKIGIGVGRALKKIL
jgi:hypothetical protein